MRDVSPLQLMNPVDAYALARPPATPLPKVDSQKGENAAALREAAKEFEALFLSYMLKVMRESIEDSGLTDDGLGKDIYTELFDQELARSLAGSGALGIGDLLLRKLEGQPPADPAARDTGVPPAPSSPGPGADKSDTGDVPDFLMPVTAHISSAYGIRQDPFTQAMRQHRGIDLAAPSGMEVHAACAGHVAFAGYQKGYGNTIVIQHPGGFETRYAHLGTLQVKTGDTLQLKQVLGTVGSTGRSTGPHLHFEISRHGVKMNPSSLLAD